MTVYRNLYVLYAFLVLSALLVLSLKPLSAAAPPDLEDQTREIAAELRCVVCQNLSVADSPSEMAQQMRAVVREQLEAGKTPDEVREFFVSKYGEWVLLKPKASGFSVLLWILPYLGLAFGLAAALWVISRWTSAKRNKSAPAQSPTAAEGSGGDFLTLAFEPPDIDDSNSRAQLMREGIRLKEELSELEFDFASEKLSQADYFASKQEIASRGAEIMRQLGALPAEAPARKREKKPPPVAERKPAAAPAGARSWRLAVGGAFLLLFGLALGVMLTQSIRPRTSESDSITGDFMTGTTPSSGNLRTVLEEGKRAYSSQDFPKAIDAFKKALAADPDNPEAHAYMGFILVQAGHSDGALMAFDKALAQAPNFPMALWGKGMVLYREQNDYAAAREIFEKLLNLMPPGEERNEIAKILMEIPARSGTPAQSAPAPKTAQAAPTSSAQISGTITVDPKLKGRIDANAVLFIIARPAGGAGGPPLAVKKIDKPEFPLQYTLGEQNVMMQGMPFTGKISVSVRLDKDGDPVTLGPGELTGEHKRNPVEVGARNVDVLLDQLAK
jgi:cytochrome c-type biogenesis protein CcmH